MQSLTHILENDKKVLVEAAVVERLRRSSDVELHHDLANAPLIYDEKGKKALKSLYQEYIDIARASNLPILLCTPTWRANRSRVKTSGTSEAINKDATSFMQELREAQHSHKNRILIGGLIGCKHDCYRPEEGLSVSEAQQFHSWQIKQLANANVDYLIAQTIPNVDEALGIAKAMDAAGIPYIISFVISRDGLILNGTSLPDAINYIDKNTRTKPAGYMVNCAHPTFLCPEKQPAELFERLIGYQANASSLDHCDLDGANQLETDSVAEWGRLMLELNSKYGMKILGGCCGTTGDHLRYIASE